MNLNRKFFAAFFLIIFCLAAYSKQNQNTNPKQPNWPDNIAMVVSVSSDGQYAVTSNLNKQVVLWNIKNKTHKTIATNANIYSTYFIKNTHYFMWQNDDTNEVIIADVNRRIIQTFNPGFSTYGQVITSDLEHYFASDEHWNIFGIYKGYKTVVKKGLWSPDFWGIGKLLNLTISNDNKILLTSGDGEPNADKVPISYGQGSAGDKHWSDSLMAGVVTWNVATGKPLRKFLGDSGMTFATLSPNGKYAVSGDVNDQAFLWYTNSGKLKLRLDSMKYGKWIKTGPSDKDYRWDKTGLIPVPQDFVDYINMYKEDVLAFRFIDSTHYLRFTTGVPYVIVYSVDSPQPLKYIKIAKPLQTVDLTKERYPAVAEYVRDQAIDTAPKAHILVMGQQKGNGIIVFKYDPKTMTLKKIWVGNFCGPRSGNPKCW